MLHALVPPVAFVDVIGNFLRYWGPGILVLSFLLLFHEFGHFLVAKRLGVPVGRFSLGFGPRLVGFRAGETDYCLSLLPLGGYVSMATEERRLEDGEEQVELVDHFTEQAWWKRAVIALAGPGANLVAGYLVMVVLGIVGVSYDDYRPRVGPVVETSAAAEAGFALGQEIERVGETPVTSWIGFREAAAGAEGATRVAVRTPDGERRTIPLPAEEREAVLGSLSPWIEARVGRVAAGFPAYTAGLQEDDRIVAVNGEPVAYWEDLTERIHGSAGVPVTFTIVRNGPPFDLEIEPVPQEIGDRTVGVIGIAPPRDDEYVVRLEPLDAVTRAFPLTAGLVTQTGRGLWSLIVRPDRAKDQLGGPLLIMRMSGEQAERGLSDFLFLMALISIAIMAFNLLPLPVLDGGHVVLAVIEGIRRRPLAERVVNVYQRLGLAMIGFLLVFIIFNDVWREAQRGRAVSRGNQVETAPEPR